MAFTIFCSDNGCCREIPGHRICGCSPTVYTPVVSLGKNVEFTFHYFDALAGEPAKGKKMKKNLRSTCPGL